MRGACRKDIYLCYKGMWATELNGVFSGLKSSFTGCFYEIERTLAQYLYMSIGTAQMDNIRDHVMGWRLPTMGSLV